MEFEYSHKDVLFDELESAIYRKNMPKINHLVSNLGVNYQTENKRNILHFCLEEANDSEMFQYLFTRYKANVHIKNGRDETLLFAARTPADVILLLSKNINIHEFNIDAQTAIEHICQHKSYEEDSIKCVELLINHGADYESIILDDDIYPPFKEQFEKLVELKKIKDEKTQLESAVPNSETKKEVKLKL